MAWHDKDRGNKREKISLKSNTTYYGTQLINRERGKVQKEVKGKVSSFLLFSGNGRLFFISTNKEILVTLMIRTSGLRIVDYES
jgi:hypothetical protein